MTDGHGSVASGSSARASVRLDEGQSVAAEADRIGEQVAPDPGGRRERRQGPAEGLDRQVAVVAALGDPPEVAVPVDLARPRDAAVVLRYVKVDRLGGAR